MFYDYFDTDLIGPLTLVADDQGLRHINFATARSPVSIQENWQRNGEFFRETKAQLRAYFKGELRQFNLSLAPQGTDFQ
ncbi:MAG: hypothetical protein PVI90_19150, partial [Desulfobacteraceae bacterium]